MFVLTYQYGLKGSYLIYLCNKLTFKFPLFIFIYPPIVQGASMCPHASSKQLIKNFEVLFTVLYSVEGVIIV